jgi:excisionase family DNA binding protein
VAARTQGPGGGPPWFARHPPGVRPGFAWAWHSCRVQPTDEARPPETTDLADLVGDWLDWSEAAERLQISVSKVRQLIRENHLAAVVAIPGAGQQVPAALIQDGVVVKGVPGVLTVLHDGGYDHRAILTWLFTSDDSLPGRPIDALRENRGSEVKRRAQAMAF